MSCETTADSLVKTMKSLGVLINFSIVPKSISFRFSFFIGDETFQHKTNHFGDRTYRGNASKVFQRELTFDLKSRISGKVSQR